MNNYGYEFPIFVAFVTISILTIMGLLYFAGKYSFIIGTSFVLLAVSFYLTITAGHPQYKITLFCVSCGMPTMVNIDKNLVDWRCSCEDKRLVAYPVRSGF